MSYSINKLTSHMLFTSKNFVFSSFQISCRKWWGLAPPAPSVYDPVTIGIKIASIKVCQLREHVMKIINFEKKKVVNKRAKGII